VGIGASAGGLAPLKAFFEALPSDIGAAFVVIQHLEPKHDSSTAEILARSTTMPAVQVINGMKVEPNHVYVIPPNVYLTLNDHTFQLAEPILRHGLRMPIDNFLWSLAEQHEERAIAIIVSGTGSDGSLGLKAIKGGGGLVLAQSPETTEFDGMPRSAIATGMVDVACAVKDMPKHLIDYLKNPYIVALTNTKQAETAAPNDAQQLNSILALLQTRSGQDFRVYKQGTLSRRINRRMDLHHINSMADYLKFMRAQKDEATLLFKDLLIGVTAFFRDTEAFEALNRKVIVPLVATKHADEVIRVWVPGCASGEEAYSIAMLLIEAIDQANKHCQIQIFASDIDEAALAVGRSGLYPKNVVANLSAERLRRFFSKEDDCYRINQSVRESVTFATQNLISDPPFSNLDLISCRNLLIYLNSDVQSKILSLFHFALRQDGCLFLGHSETSSQQEDLFETLAKKWRIYRRCGAARPTNLVFPSGSRTKIDKPGISPKITSNQRVRLGEVAQQYLLKEFSPAAVLVNHNHQILHFSGPTSRYLEQPPGAPTQDLLTLARHELRTKLRIALRRVISEKQRIVVDDVQVLRDGIKVVINVILRPVLVPKLSEPLILITFEDLLGLPLVSHDKKVEGKQSAPSLLQQMENELLITREDLQSNIEELESANEELQAANEEVMSVNEELQSSSEEMESSKEELQSMNEELSTVNSQYKDKVDELAKTNDDLSNLLTSTDIATLFISAQLKIGRFTPATGRLLNLLVSDIGRPLRDIRLKFTDSCLLEDAQLVLDKLSPIESEINTEDGMCYLRRIVPYRTTDNRIEGVVITFINITQRKKAEEDNLRLATVIRDSNDAVTLTDPEGKIIAWNKGAIDTYGWSEQEALTMNIRELIPENSLDNTFQLLQRRLKREDIHSAETQRISKDGQIIEVSQTVTPLFDKAGKITAIANTEHNISRRKRAEESLRASEANFRALVESAPDALVIVNRQGKIEEANSQAENLFGYAKSELLGMEVEDLMPPRYASGHVIKRKEYVAQPKVRVIGNGLELFALNKSSEEIPIEVSLSPIETDHGQVVIAAIRDIRERKIIEEALLNAKVQAESALATKSRFLATASHDLRQPLHSLNLLNNTLLKCVEQPNAQKMLRMQSESLGSMARLLSSLLDISKLESGTVEVQKSNFDLRPLLQKLCDEFQGEALEKGLQLSIEANQVLPVNSDPTLLGQLLQNLLANAIRYCEKGFVKLSCIMDEEQIKISVSDSGIGIPAEQLGHIFNEFHQVNRDPQMHHGGLGLGLSIVQRIAALLDSSIEVSSKEGIGSTFSIKQGLGRGVSSAPTYTQSEGENAHSNNAVILLIDDDPSVLDASEMLLSMEQGFEIITATSPPEAFKVMDKLTPDLIISDFHLNHKENGADIIHRARTIGGQQIPAILVSGDTSSTMDEMSAQDIVVTSKPVDPDKLISLARKLLAERVK
jgi:two-component system CheB/CheR fusion protein